MKRFVLILCAALAIFPLSGTALSAKTASDVKSNLNSLVREYRHRSGFDVVNVGNMMLGITRAAMKAAAKEDPELKAGVQLLSGIKGMWVVDFEDASRFDARQFTSRVEKILEGAELLMEVKDEEDSVYMYGSVADGGEYVRDVVVFMPEGTLICFWGKVSKDNIQGLLEMSKSDELAGED